MTKPEKRPTTRADVARLAGVSTAVVSYVINSGPRTVSEATRGRVLDAIEKLDYRPNASARALKLGSTGMIGVVVAEIANPYFSELIEAVDVAASLRGRNILLTNTRGRADRERDAVSTLVDRGVDGLIFLAHMHDDRLYRFAEGTVPRIACDRTYPIPGVPTIGPDTLEATSRAVTHLIEHGHTAIALVMGTSTQDLRRAGWEQALAQAGLRPRIMRHTSWDREGGYATTMDLMSSKEKPTAIFAGSDLIAVGALHALNDLGLRVPEDIAVISFDGTKESAYSAPPLTTVQQPFHEIAQAAVTSVLTKGAPTSHVALPMELVIRRSCGCQGEGVTSGAASGAATAT